MTTVSNRVFARDNFGRFLAKMEDAASRTVDETLRVGINASRMAAPEKTGRLKASFYAKTNGHSGYFGNFASYAKFQDQGAGPNEKPADVSFFWEGQGRLWRADTTGTQNIQHPGNPATHFMDKGYQAMRMAAPGIMQKHYL